MAVSQLIQGQNAFLAASTGTIVPYIYEISSGFSFELSAQAVFEID